MIHILATLITKETCDKLCDTHSVQTDKQKGTIAKLQAIIVNSKSKRCFCGRKSFFSIKRKVIILFADIDYNTMIKSLSSVQPTNMSKLTYYSSTLTILTVNQIIGHVARSDIFNIFVSENFL